MLQAAATLPRFPEPRRWAMPRRPFTFSLLAGLIAIGLVGAATGLVGRAWYFEHEATASTQRAVAALERDGFSVRVSTPGGRVWPTVYAHGEGPLSARSVHALLQARRVAAFRIERSGALPLPLDRLSKRYSVRYDDGCFSFTPLPHVQRGGWWP